MQPASHAAAPDTVKQSTSTSSEKQGLYVPTGTTLPNTLHAVIPANCHAIAHEKPAC